MSWTDEQIIRLRELWDEGKSTGEIGKILGVSKNAVVGKAHRLVLPARPSPIKRSAEEEQGEEVNERGRKPVKKAAPAKPKSPKKDKNKKGVTLMELTSHSCRWPVGDPKDEDFHFCGEEAELGKTYCAKHIAEAFVGIIKK